MGSGLPRTRKTLYSPGFAILHTIARMEIILHILAIVVGLSLAVGYTAMFWALGIPNLYEAFKVSGSSLLTLGFATGDNLAVALLEFSEATLGLIMVALLIAYLPTIYAAFAKRETVVSMLEVR